MAAIRTDKAPADPQLLDAAAVDAAIAGVLAAEHGARQDVACAIDEAAALLQQARDHARAIAARGAQRVAQVHRSTTAAIAARVRALEGERARVAAAPPLEPADQARLQAAVACLAAELLAAERPPADVVAAKAAAAAYTAGPP